MNKKNKAFTLVEVLVFTAILSLFFVSAVSVTTMTIKQAGINKNKIIATHYADELLSMLQSERELGWDEFVAHASTGNKTYCVNGDEIDWLITTCDPQFGLNGYERTVTLKTVGTPVSQMTVLINVKWQDGNNTYQVPLQSVFNLWEQ